MNRFTKVEKEEIEKIAAKNLNAIKLKENLYIIPDKVMKSSDTDKKQEFTLDTSSLEIEKGNKIISLFKRKINEDENIIEVINLSNGKNKEFLINREINSSVRKQIINAIAYDNKNKEIIISFYLPYDLEQLSLIIKNKD